MYNLNRLSNPEEWRLRDYILPLTLIGAISIGGSLLFCECLDYDLDILKKAGDGLEWLLSDPL